jgi:hypothetical protein
MVPASNFLFDDNTSNDVGASTDKTSGSTTFESETILYQWCTKTAVRRFCKTCGILSFYIPRSNPDGYAITYHCVDWGEDGPPETEIKYYDGENWEKSHAATGIAKETDKS